MYHAFGPRWARVVLTFSDEMANSPHFRNATQMKFQSFIAYLQYGDAAFHFLEGGPGHRD